MMVKELILIKLLNIMKELITFYNKFFFFFLHIFRINKMNKLGLYFKIPDNSTDIELKYVKYEIYGISRPYFKCIGFVFTKCIATDEEGFNYFLEKLSAKEKLYHYLSSD